MTPDLELTEVDPISLDESETTPRGYTQARNFDNSGEDLERLPDGEKRHRKPVNRYPEGHWVRGVRIMGGGEGDVAVALLDLRYGYNLACGRSSGD